MDADCRERRGGHRHIPNKRALLDAIVEAVMAEIDLDGDDPAAPPEDRIMYAERAYPCAGARVLGKRGGAGYLDY